MNEHERDRTEADDYDRDAISLRPYLDTLRRYRAVIVGAIVGASVLFVIGVLAMLVIFPSERVASLPFRLLFEGAAQNQYPNKTPFNPTEIVGVPVVTEVFKANDLQQYGKLRRFQGRAVHPEFQPRAGSAQLRVPIQIGRHQTDRGRSEPHRGRVQPESGQP